MSGGDVQVLNFVLWVCNHAAFSPWKILLTWLVRGPRIQHHDWLGMLDLFPQTLPNICIKEVTRFSLERSWPTSSRKMTIRRVLYWGRDYNHTKWFYLSSASSSSILLFGGGNRVFIREKPWRKRIITYLKYVLFQCTQIGKLSPQLS